MADFSKNVCAINPVNFVISKATIDDSEQIVKFLNHIAVDHGASLTAINKDAQ